MTDISQFSDTNISPSAPVFEEANVKSFDIDSNSGSSVAESPVLVSPVSVDAPLPPPGFDTLPSSDKQEEVLVEHVAEAEETPEEEVQIPSPVNTPVVEDPVVVDSTAAVLRTPVAGLRQREPQQDITYDPRAADVFAFSTGSDNLDNLILWKNAKLTGFVFAFVNAVFYLTQIANYSVLGLSAKIVYWLFITGVVAERASSFLRRFELLPPRFDPKKRGLFVNGESLFKFNNELAVNAVQTTTTAWNATVGATFKLVTEGRFSTQVKAGLALYFAAFIGNIFSFVTILYVGFFGLFTLPIAYLANQSKVDETYAQVEAQARVHLGKATVEAGKYYDQAKVKGFAVSRQLSDKMTPHINKVRSFIRMTPTPTKTSEEEIKKEQ